MLLVNFRQGDWTGNAAQSVVSGGNALIESM
jgi:hypothetical protein